MAASAVSAYIQCLELPLPPIVFSYNPEAYTIEKKMVDSNTRLTVQLAEGGGAAVSIIAM